MAHDDALVHDLEAKAKVLAGDCLTQFCTFSQGHVGGTMSVLEITGPSATGSSLAKDTQPLLSTLCWPVRVTCLSNCWQVSASQEQACTVTPSLALSPELR